MPEDVTLIFAPWCTLTGGLVFTILLFAWRSQCWVFFDQICIHQYEAHLKTSGILSIGSFLKCSEKFLLVWDETYTQRLWCMLELAAFCSSHEQPEAKIRIRPTAMAPCVLAVAVSSWAQVLLYLLTLFEGAFYVQMAARWAALYVVVAFSRAQYRTMEAMFEKLSSFTVEGAACACCDRGHEMRDGRPVDLCDRDVVLECIRSWYGSVQSFEGIVKLRMRNMLYHQLGTSLFPYAWLVVSSAPLFWGWLDIIASRARGGFWREVAITLVGALGWSLFMFPVVFQTSLIVARYCRHRAREAWQDQLKTIIAALAPTLLSFLGNWTSRQIKDLPQAFLWASGWALLAGISRSASWYHKEKVDIQGHVEDRGVQMSSEASLGTSEKAA